MQSIITNSAAETEKFAQELAGKLKGNDVLAFFGGLGMGKPLSSVDWRVA